MEFMTVTRDSDHNDFFLNDDIAELISKKILA